MWAARYCYRYGRCHGNHRNFWALLAFGFDAWDIVLNERLDALMIQDELFGLFKCDI